MSGCPDRTEAACRLYLKAWRWKEFLGIATLLKLGSVCLESPVADIYSSHFYDTLSHQTEAGSADFYTALGKVAGRISLGRFSLTDANIRYAYYGKSDSLQHQKLDTTNLFVEGLAVDTRLRTYKLDDIRFSTRNLGFFG